MKKASIENIILFGVAGLLLIGWGCTETKYITIAPPNPTKQDEAKSKLQEIYQQQLAYRQYSGVYWGSNEIGSAANPYAFLPINVDFNYTRYSYAMVLANTTSFLCMAAFGYLDNDATQDLWQIDHTGYLVCLSDDTRM